MWIGNDATSTDATNADRITLSDAAMAISPTQYAIKTRQCVFCFQTRLLKLLTCV